jgi:hypothetical protein
MTTSNEPVPSSSRDVKSTDDYTSRLLKLLPAEITGAYLAIRLVVPSETSQGDGAIAVFAILILLISPWFMWRVLQMRQTKQIVFLMFSYIVWVANIEISRINDHADAIRNVPLSLPLLGPIAGQFTSWLISPIAIKGAAIIWLVLLSPLVFAKEALRSSEQNGANPANMAPVPQPDNPSAAASKVTGSIGGPV